LPIGGAQQFLERDRKGFGLNQHNRGLVSVTVSRFQLKNNLGVEDHILQFESMVAQCVNQIKKPS
jgi:hypothetical protein